MRHSNSLDIDQTADLTKFWGFISKAQGSFYSGFPLFVTRTSAKKVNRNEWINQEIDKDMKESVCLLIVDKRRTTTS